jgi:microcystin-dependent protein
VSIAANVEKPAFDTTSTGSGNAVDNMSPYLVLNYIIKT